MNAELKSPDTLVAPEVVLLGDFTEAQLARLRNAAPQARVTVARDCDALGHAIATVDVILGFVPPEALGRARRLKWVHARQAGPDKQLYDAMLRSPVTLTSSKSNGAAPLAEHAILLMLMLDRHALRWVDAQRARRWDRFTHGELRGRTCGIIGAGFSGQDLALKARAFHMRVLGLRRHVRPTAGFDEMYGQDQLSAFLAECDFVVVTAPLTEQTRGLLGVEAFRAMKPSAHYICISRGGIAEDEALLQALREGWIAGAGLDAHAEEPLPADSPFWDLPNVIVTPHNGATTVATHERGHDIFVENLRRFVNGDPLLNIVDKALGY